MPTKSHFVLSVQLLIVKTIRQTHVNQMLNILFPVIGSHEQEVKSNSARCSQDGFWLVVVSGFIERYKDSSH